MQLAKCPPAYVTGYDENAASELGAIKVISQLMNRRDNEYKLQPGSLKPHQEVICELGSIKQGERYRYPTFIITAPRRIGKTVALEATAVARCILYPGFSVWYTSQTASDAYMWFSKLCEVIEDSPLIKDQVVWPPRYSNTNPSIKFKNGSSIQPFTPSPKALDGKNTDLIIIDEAFAIRESVGSLFMSSVVPTGLNRPRSQLWIISTAGHSGSTWFKSWVDKGRDSVNDPNSLLSFIEWSAPEDTDVENPKLWEGFHPGLAYGLTSLDGMLAARSKQTTLAEWRRSYANQWVTVSAEGFVNLEAWEQLAVTTPAAPPGIDQISLAIDVAADSSAATIAAAWTLDDNTPYITIVKRAPGYMWLDSELANLGAARAKSLTYDSAGATATAVKQFTGEIKTKATEIKFSEYSAACQELITRTDTATLAHRDSKPLKQALAAAGKQYGGGKTSISLNRSSEPVDAARAAALALYRATSATYTPLVV